jgi:acyl-CoA thioester hydrolase
MSEALGRFPVTVEIPVQWGDMDAFGHVNNTVYLRWFESARIAYFERLKLGGSGSGVGPILARATVDYRIPLRYPDTIRASATVVKLGNTSFTMNYRVTSSANAGTVAAEGEGVIVLVDYAKGGKVPLDDELRGKIGELEARGS